MPPDERSIRSLVEAWLAASKDGDIAKVLTLMTDDVEFLVSGQPPFGKAAFAAASGGSRPSILNTEHRIVELEIAGSWAWMRSHLSVTLQPAGATTAPVVKAGPILTILRKGSDGQWRIARDANLLT